MSELRLRYQTIELGDVDVHVRSLWDNQQFSDDDGEAEALGISSAMWPIFGIVWASGRALAHLMLDYDLRGRRILELGCGIGLASLVLAQRDADITATDRHPEAEGFLRENAALNGHTQIPFERTGWADTDDTLGTFDLIIASDVLYERTHGPLVADFIGRHANPSCEVVVMDPGRGNAGPFARVMKELGFSFTRAPAATDSDPDKAYKGEILRFVR